jgi:hypothetical protein
MNSAQDDDMEDMPDDGKDPEVTSSSKKVRSSVPWTYHHICLLTTLADVADKKCLPERLGIQREHLLKSDPLTRTPLRYNCQVVTTIRRN